ncbi:hypothetical protein DFJ63DRAFT_289805 [Scheffersomyces coipomensis]|uniref:uncharacterized protein n=1 Tax=Scheffersomyces coipomensis TaxID=1788519 RepID=UPI00315D4048
MPDFKQVDVFTNVKFKGNPLAVFFDATHLSNEDMKAISNWTNLSETTFVLPPTKPEADYKVRIFTTQSELPFAGHPTLGTCFSLLEAGKIQPNSENKIYPECGAGIVEISVENFTTKDDLSQVYLSFKLPYYKSSSISDEQLVEVAESLNLKVDDIITKPILIDDGPKWLTFQLKSGQSVLDLNPSYDVISDLSIKYDWAGYGIYGKYEDGSLELRNLAPVEGVKEDPACGSGAGAVGAYIGSVLKEHKLKSKISIKQGAKLSRDAKLSVTIDVDDKGEVVVYVGGQVVTCINGSY